MTKRRFALGGGLATVLAVFFTTSLPAFSDANGAVTATVTPLVACLTLDKTSIDFGTLPFSPTGGVTNRGTDVTATNCGGTAEQIYGRGTDAANSGGSVTWTLDSSGALPCTLGTNKFQLAETAADNSWGIYLSKADQQLGSGSLGGGATATYRNGMRMPCTGSGGAGQTMSWQYIYTATL
jgi:hypothetical protein